MFSSDKQAYFAGASLTDEETFHNIDAIGTTSIETLYYEASEIPMATYKESIYSNSSPLLATRASPTSLMDFTEFIIKVQVMTLMGQLSFKFLRLYFTNVCN